ncbi:MAG: SDR family oxidoreductase [Myxococcales bacterium]|nr:SDR family oxidoreductase [Myxococcales bacterium]
MPTLKGDTTRQDLVVFGATGVTGSYVVRLALEEGLSVRAAVRSPHKLPTDLASHERLDVVRVDVTDAAAVDRAIEGTTMVFAALGYKGRPDSPILLPFVRQVVQSMRDHGARRFVYQASGFNTTPRQPSSGLVRLLLRRVVGWVIGVQPLWNEHDAAIRFLVEEARDLDWTVTRPGRLSDGASQGALTARQSPGGGVRYRDLADFSLQAARTGAHARSSPFVGYA